MGVGYLDWEDSQEKGMAAHSSILAWRIPVDRGAWWTTIHGITKSQTQLSTHAINLCTNNENWIKRFTEYGPAHQNKTQFPPQFLPSESFHKPLILLH